MREEVASKWISLRLREVASIAPAVRASLNELLLQEDPHVPTQGRGVHRFNRGDLERSRGLLSEIEADARIFPIVLAKFEDLGGDSYVIQGGEIASRVFSKLLGSKLVNRTEDGLYYTYKSAVIEFSRRFPSLAVIVG
ncbi:MAG: DUF61 family protein [Aigarchaeota archaeon]|nr:DUF61 family protein [Aigarchaeota archaeon]MDW8092278.1 DUF61 family protein [Nitrososphaerota archaeon]